MKSSGSIERAKTLMEIMKKANYYKSLKVYDSGEVNVLQNSNSDHDVGMTTKSKRGSKRLVHNFIST